MELYETLPIVPLRDVVVFPHMMMPFVIGRPSSTRALEHALVKDKRIGNLLLMVQHGSMPTELTKQNISLLAEKVMPRLRAAWQDAGFADQNWEHKWWPTGLPQ